MREWWLVFGLHLAALLLLFTLGQFYTEFIYMSGWPLPHVSWLPTVFLVLYAGLYWPALAGLTAVLSLGLLAFAYAPVRPEALLLQLLLAWAFVFWLRARMRVDLANHIRLAALWAQLLVLLLSLFFWSPLIPWSRLLFDVAFHLLVAVGLITPWVYGVRRLIIQVDPMAAMAAKKAMAGG